MTEILKFTIPSIIISGTLYQIFRLYLQNEKKNEILASPTDSSDALFPVQLQAYERLVLYLERISFNNLILRASVQGATVRQLQSAMVHAIRDEYEHNLSQQLYVSDAAWEQVTGAKEELLRILNQTAAGLPPEAEATELAAGLFSAVLKHDPSPNDRAVHFLKQEMRNRF
jgi:hypothetical protein